LQKSEGQGLPTDTRIKLPMADLLKMEFLLLQYAPNAVTEEAINIGVLVLSKQAVDVRFREDWDALSRFDPYVDLEMLDAIRRDIEMKLHSSERDDMFETIETSFSNTIRCSDRGQLLCENPATEIDRLVRMYL
jgi:Protein of unknown function (DUF3037)